MATAFDPVNPGKMNFPGPIGTKRRRMRSGGNVSTHSSTSPTTLQDLDDDEKTAQTSKCKGATTIPIFLKKTYKMVDTCDPSIASWTEDGEMFVVKDPDVFASQVIPQYFDHNKFSSFARQLNFYGFRKMQSKPIRNSDYDAGTAKHVTFFNENFKRGRCDLLKKIQRSTRGGTNTTQDYQKEIQNLKDHVSSLEQKIVDMGAQTEERIRRLELDMLARMEQMMLTVQRQQQAQLQLQKAASVGSSTSGASATPSQLASGPASAPVQAWDPNAFSYPRGTSVASLVDSLGGNNTATGAPTSGMGGSGLMANSNNNHSNNNNNNNNMMNNTNSNHSSNNMMNNNNNHHNNNMMNNTFQQPAPSPAYDSNPGGGPTLPPHPKQKQLPRSILPPAVGNMPAPPDRLNSLRGISQLSRGLSGLSRGASIESTASAVLMRNSLEDKYFSMLMLEGGDPNANGNSAGSPAAASMQNNGPMPAMSFGGFNTNQNGFMPFGGSNSNQNGSMSLGGYNSNQNGPVTVTDRSMDMGGSGQQGSAQQEHDDLSSVSSSGMA